ncbi:protein kinase domain-containing protein [Megalodesulfovibrio paquesii]
MPLAPGALLGGYIIQHVLGKGAFGITYLALDSSLNTQVAIKEYYPRDIATRDAQGAVLPASAEKAAYFHAGREAFLEEARTLARFKHPHIVRILSFFEAGNTACFVMDYERGQSLKALLRRRGTLSGEEVTDLLTPLLDGLEQLHNQDVLHRDIKPGNIYIRQNGEPVLLDFGAACRRLGGGGRLTSLVTEGYAPPEQYQADHTLQGPWTDCYALAAVALRCLTGETLPSATSRQQALALNQADPLAPLLEQAATASPALGEVLRQGLALDAAQRVRSVRDWRQLFEAQMARECTGSLEHSGEPAREVQEPVALLLVSAMEEHGEEDAAALRQCLPVKLRQIRTGEEALQILSRESLHGCVVDSLLEDMSGLELLRRMRDVVGLQQTPLVYASAALTREQELEAASLGACAVLIRPVSEQAMVEALQQLAMYRSSHAAETQLVRTARAALQAGDCPAAHTVLEAWRPLLPVPASDAAGRKKDAPAPGRLQGAAVTLFAQGCKAMLQGRLQEAGLSWAMSRKAAVLEAEARIAMAEAHRMAGRLQAFAGCAQEAHQVQQCLERMDLVATTMADTLLLDSRRPLPLNTVGVQLRRAGELAASELAYAIALELSPYDPRVHFNLAKALAHNGRHKEAFDEICRALKLDPDFEEAEALYRKITGKAWHTGGGTRPPRSLSGLYQPLLDV